MNEIKVINPTFSNVSDDKLEKLVTLINHIYLISEGELWPHDGTYFRTTIQEIKTFIAKGYLRFAILENEIIGMIKVFEKSEDLGCFGMLAVNPSHRKYRIGSLLVQHAENWCVTLGLSNIELELLVANDFIMEEKVTLRNWYNRIGYGLVETIPFEDLYPSHTELIQVPCSFEIMRKKL